MHLAARDGHFEVCDLLVRAGADFTAKNNVSVLLLVYASSVITLFYTSLATGVVDVAVDVV